MNLKLNILHIIDSEGFFGAEVFVLNLMEAQMVQGLHPKLLCIGDIGVGEKDIEKIARNKKLLVHSLRFKKGFNINGSRKILTLAKELRIDILHSHGYKSNVLLGVIPRTYRKIPLISTLHGWSSRSFKEKLWFYELLDAAVLINHDAVVVVSPSFLKNKKLKFFGIKPEIILNGIPILEFKQIENKKIYDQIRRFTQNKFSIVAIGRLSAEKGYDILLQALSIVYKNHLSVCLTIIGDGPEKEKLLDLVNELKIKEIVQFTGYLNNAYTYLPCFDLFIISSYTEGLPITLLEAMQAGVPVLATAVGAIPNVLENKRLGLLTPSGDPKSLAQEIIYAATMKNEMEQKAQIAREIVIGKFSIAHTADAYFNLYKKLLG